MKASALDHLKCWQLDVAGGLVGVVITFAVYLVGLSPLWERQEQIEQRRVQLNDQSQNALKLGAQSRLLSTQLAVLKKDLADIALELQPANRVNERIALITTKAGECGLDVNNVQPGKSIVSSRHTIVPIEVSGSGNFRNCVRFLHQFNQTFGDSGVASFELAASPGSPGSPTSFHFRLHWYVEPKVASVQ